ncbi:MAG: OmpA family protein [Gammaproteobacteria bacterium]|nr:OmpA family protein [Gammaproteobacteria bacterium]
MPMRRFFSRTAPPLILLGLGVVLGACGVPEEEPPAAVEDSKILLEEDPDAVEGVALDDEGNIVTGDLDISLEDGSAAGTAAGATDQGMTIYFDYDSTTVKPRFAEIIQRAAAHLQNNPAGRLRLEGHTDERGTRAYNLALGERRAQSVRDMILELGALAEQVDWVSYGEELPAVTGQDEGIWGQNRRVEIILEE